MKNELEKTHEDYKKATKICNTLGLELTSTAGVYRATPYGRNYDVLIDLTVFFDTSLMHSLGKATITKEIIEQLLRKCEELQSQLDDANDSLSLEFP